MTKKVPADSAEHRRKEPGSRRSSAKICVICGRIKQEEVFPQITQNAADRFRLSSISTKIRVICGKITSAKPVKREIITTNSERTVANL